jgi:hypothetical protein
MRPLYHQQLCFLFLTATLALSCSKDENASPVTAIRYENPVIVTLEGYSDHAMEPFLSLDGNTLFFNDLNSGPITKLHYATKQTTTLFTYEGILEGVNPMDEMQLDAVPDLDFQGNFYWTSTRDYPQAMDNMHYGVYADGTITDIGRLQGDFYVNEPGWLLMDHGISYDGQMLYFNNANFGGQNCAGPCETRLGIAKKVNDSTFLKIAQSDEILQNINDQNYKYYAPSITKDDLELYYTRYTAGTLNENSISEICVATRDSPTGIFSEPSVLFSDTLFDKIVEAPTLTIDKQLMYYHKKIDGIHKILMRERK